MRNHSFTVLFVFILGAYFASSISVPAAQAPEAGQSPNRFLLVVDTSLSMRSRAKGVQTAVRSLLQSGMSHQMHGGDTLGVWTFNDTLYAGRFPLQRWTPATSELVASNVTSYLQKQPYEKATNFDEMLRGVFRVIQDSEKITVVLISDSDEPIKGTPFDEQINAAYEKSRRAQKRARMPFVTVLRGEKGRLVDFRVNTPPWPIEFPPLPAPPPPTPVVAPPPAPAVSAPPVKPSPPVLPPLIISGKKAETSPAASLSQAADEKPAAQTVASESPETAPPTQFSVSATVEPVEPITQPTAAAVAAPASSPAVTPSVTVEPSSQSERTEVTPTVSPTPIEPRSAALPEERAATAFTPPPAPARIENEPRPVEPGPVLETQTPESMATESSQAASPAGPPAQTGVAVPKERSFPMSFVWITAALAVAGLVILFFARRSPPSHASLITKSLDHDKKR